MTQQLSHEELKENKRTLREHRRHKKTKEVLVSVGVIAALVGITILAGRVGRRHQLLSEARDGREARLIDHRICANQAQQLLAGSLFFDTNGNTNTAEIVTHYHTLCAHEVEAVRQMRIGEVRKVSEWKGALRGKCRLEHFIWNELEKGN